MAQNPNVFTPTQKKDGLGGPGQGNLRTPFVDLYLLGVRIPLIDSGIDVPGAPLPEGPQRLAEPVERPLLLVDFRYMLKSRIGAANEVSITILDPNWDYLENLLMANLKARASFGFTFGWRQEQDVQRGPQLLGLFLRSYSVTYLPFQGARVELRAVDKTVQLSFERLTQGFPAERPISSIIKDLVEDIPTVKCECETIAQPVGPENNRMENQTRTEYITHLLEIAKSKEAGAGDWIAKVVPDGENTLLKIFADVSRPNVKNPTFVIGRERQGRMIDFSPSVLGSVLLSHGGGKAIGIGFDAKTKRAIKVTTTDEDDNITHPRRVNPTPSRPTGIYEIPYGRAEDVEGFVKGMRGRIDKVQFNATATLLGDTSLEVFTHINVVVLKSNVPGTAERVTDRDVVHVSGVYRIKTVEHIIQPGMFRTLLTLYRESGFAGAGSAGKPIPISFKLPDESDLIEMISQPLELQQGSGLQTDFTEGFRRLTGGNFLGGFRTIF